MSAKVDLEPIKQQLLQQLGLEGIKKLYYDNLKNNLEPYLKEQYGISFYLFQKSAIELGIPKKPRELYINQRSANMLATKAEKYENGNYDSDKFHSTMFERYGGVGNASPIIRQHQYESMIEKYGVDNAFKDPYGLNKNAYLPETLEKGKQTTFERYGKRSCIDQEKAKQTKLNKYGDPNYTNREKAKQTYFEKTGYDHPFKNPDVVQKAKQTYFEKTGYDHQMHNPNVINKARKKYSYDNEWFDSSWELALYLCAKDHNQSIKRLPMGFEYYYNDKKHYYFPDFEYNGQLVEIKGDHMLDEDFNLIDFYNNHENDELMLCKQKCIEDNNVTIMTYSDIKFAMDYVKQNYDLKQYKNS